MVITGEQLQQLATSSGVDPELDFRKRLSEASTAFVTSFQAWVESEAMDMASKGRRQSHRKYPHAFHERLHGFRVSTYVKGFRTADGSFDSSRFQEVGFSEDVGTPFEQARLFLRERGIYVEDVSDPSKGLGFWLRISF